MKTELERFSGEVNSILTTYKEFANYIFTLWGEEEFVLLLADIGKEKALETAEDIRQLIANSE